MVLFCKECGRKLCGTANTCNKTGFCRSCFLEWYSEKSRKKPCSGNILAVRKYRKKKKFAKNLSRSEKARLIAEKYS